MQSGGAVRDWAALFTRRQSEDMSVLAQDYPSAPANPSSLAKRDARGFFENFSFLILTNICSYDKLVSNKRSALINHKRPRRNEGLV